MEVEQATKRDSRSCLIVMKHACKFCHKRFTCGRSLGGHMRSHLITNPIDQEKVNTTINKQQQIQLVSRAATDSFSGEAGYELRENPKKTWRAIGSALDSTCDQDPNLTPFREGNNFCCKECGKAFHSSKALYGHMKSHAVERVKEKERLIVGDPDPCNNGQSDINYNRPRRSSRKPRNMEFSTNDYNSSKIGSCSDSEIDQQEQEEVALCLILLSKNVSILGEISHNSDFFLEDKGVNIFNRVLWESNKSKGFNSDECTKVSCGIELSGVELGQNLSSKSVLIECNLETSKRKAKDEDLESDKRSKFECNTCNRTFHSHQALGGHRANHKKIKGCSERSETRVPPAFHYHNQAKELSSNEVAQRHECPICFRVFPSGQALGGHKRSHFIVKSPSKTNVISVNNNITTASTTTTHEARDFLDLNLPALVEEGVDGLKPWSVDSTSKHEQIVGMI